MKYVKVTALAKASYFAAVFGVFCSIFMSGTIGFLFLLAGLIGMGVWYGDNVGVFAENDEDNLT